MKAYSARIIFDINIEECPDQQYDEQLLVIFAESDKEAFGKAIIKGEEESETFVNSKGQKVNWQFMGVTEIKALDTGEDTVFVNGRTLQPERSLTFAQYVQKQTEILSKQYHYALKSSLLDH